MNNRNRGINSRNRNNSQSIGSTFISLGIILVVFVVISFVFWNLANEKVVAANTFYQDPEDVNLGNEKVIIGTKEVTLPAKGEELGILKIPSINLESKIFVGDSDNELAKGCGMDTNMKYPGQDGNVVLAGHTNLVFKTLGEAKDGDEVIIDTSYATFTYKIASHEIVSAKDKNVIVPKESEFLTIYTCYPFNFLASTDKRYVVRCNLVDKQEKNELKSQ